MPIILMEIYVYDIFCACAFGFLCETQDYLDLVESFSTAKSPSVCVFVNTGATSQ